ncbi:hypothetical protein ACJMK2_018258 [Sinanodonta woodiana]|uniref:Uncharacterized protein n=1 Tax=Sinanodonta woodiana TaxID=1069815 RepID=A0ABD3UFJ8_SINWO
MHRLANQLRTRLESETCENKRQRLADRYSAFLSAEIDAYATTFQEQSCDRDPLEDLKRIIPWTSNTLVTEMEYYGRQAHRSAIMGRFEDAGDYLKRANSVSMFIGPCQEKINMVFLDVLVKLREFENDPSDDLMHKLMETGKYGLSLLEKEDEETRCLWKRFFAVRMTYCALGMGFKANIIDRCSVTRLALQKAELLLKQVDTESIELKHEMIFLAARARFRDLSGSIMEACHDINEAESIAVRGNFTEIKFIREYRQLIENKISAWTTVTTPDGSKEKSN